MSTPVKEFMKDDLTVSIYQDEGGESPREWCNLGKTAFFHRRYDLGDRGQDFDSPEEVKEWLETDEGKAAVVIPVYMYDHSGISLSTRNSGYPFNCRWVAGQLGIIYATEERIKEELQVAEVDDATRRMAEKQLQDEIETLNQFVTGDVYYYSITDAEGEHLDGCGGVYGLQYCEEEARSVADGIIKARVKEVEECAQENGR